MPDEPKTNLKAALAYGKVSFTSPDDETVFYIDNQAPSAKRPTGTMQMAAPGLFPKRHAAVFADGDELVLTVADETLPVGSAQRHHRVGVQLDGLVNALTPAVDLMSSLIDQHVIVVPRDQFGPDVLVGPELLDSTLLQPTRTPTRTRGTRFDLLELHKRIRVVHAQEFIDGPDRIGLVLLPPDAYGRRFVPYMAFAHPEHGVVVAVPVGVFSEIQRAIAATMPEVLRHVRASFAVPEVNDSQEMPDLGRQLYRRAIDLRRRFGLNLRPARPRRQRGPDTSA